MGIAPEQIESLFETFVKRGDETSSNYGQDAGIGFPLAHRLCTLMHGSLTVESTLGKGSRFIIRVPNRIGEITNRAPDMETSAPRLAMAGAA